MALSYLKYGPLIRRKVGALACVGLLWIGFTGPAHAYLDPGTGSLILQGLIAGAAAVAAAGGVFWHRIKSAFSRTSSQTLESESQDDNDE